MVAPNRRIFNWTLRNKLQRNSNQNTKVFSHENVFECVDCEMTATSSRRDESNLSHMREPTLTVSRIHPESKVHVTNMGPIGVLSTPGEPHFGPTNLVIREAYAYDERPADYKDWQVEVCFAPQGDPVIYCYRSWIVIYDVGCMGAFRLWLLGKLPGHRNSKMIYYNLTLDAPQDSLGHLKWCLFKSTHPKPPPAQATLTKILHCSPHCTCQLLSPVFAGTCGGGVHIKIQFMFRIGVRS